MIRAMNANAVTESIIGGAIEVHRELGPGKPEAAYERALCRELELRGTAFRAQKPLPIVYKGVRLDCGYRLDILAENTVVVEVKALEAVAPVHDAQVITYLKLGGWKVGLLLNFHVAVLKRGIRRLVLGFEEEGRTTPEARSARGCRDVKVDAETVPRTQAGLQGDADSNRISHAVLDAALEVHRQLGPGLLASAYEACLCHELALRHLPFERRVQVPLVYKGRALQETMQVPLLVTGRVVVAPKAVTELLPVHEADLLTQLRLGGWPQGLLLNFNTWALRDDLRRLLNDGPAAVGQ